MKGSVTFISVYKNTQIYGAVNIYGQELHLFRFKLRDTKIDNIFQIMENETYTYKVKQLGDEQKIVLGNNAFWSRVNSITGVFFLNAPMGKCNKKI